MQFFSFQIGLAQNFLPENNLHESSEIFEEAFNEAQQDSGIGSSTAQVQDPGPNAGSGQILDRVQEQLLPTEESGGGDEILVTNTGSIRIVINELQWVGTEGSTADEWVELYAADLPSASGVVLDGWSIEKWAAGGFETMVLLNGIHLYKGEFAVIANYAASQSALNEDAAIISTAVSLPNTGLRLRLLDASGTVVDEVDDGIGIPMAGGKQNGYWLGMERIDANAPGTDVSNWQSAQTARGLDYDAKTLGTPGFTNGSIEPPDTTPPMMAPAGAIRSGSGITVWWNTADGDDGFILLDTGSGSGDLLRFPTEQGKADLTAQTVLYTGALLLFREDRAGNRTNAMYVPIDSHTDLSMQSIFSNPAVHTTAEYIDLVWRGKGLLRATDIAVRVGDRLRMVQAAGSGSIVMSGQVLRLGSPNVPLPLPIPNAGAEVSVLLFGSTADSVQIPSLPGDVLWYHDGTREPWHPLCPTEDVDIVVQSGRTTGAAPASLNLQASAPSGAVCTWEYGDGYSYLGCNPPSHSFSRSGTYDIQVEVKDYCGTTITRTLTVSYSAKGNNIQDDNEIVAEKCMPSAFSGVTISEFLPDPSGDEQQEEWIELKNDTAAPLSLCGWWLDDEPGGSSPYALDSYTLQGSGYVVIPRTDSNIALNNDQDMVRLIAPQQGGGTGTLLSLPYQRVPTDHSWALRQDGVWLASAFLTPGSANRFTEVSMEGLKEVIRLVAAMPNPQGHDAGAEWIELENMTTRPQWLDGWTLETQDGKHMQLDGIVLARIEVLRLRLPTYISLRNTHGYIVLRDADGRIRSTLSWKTAKQGQRIVPPAMQRMTVDSVERIDDDELRIRRFAADEQPLFSIRNSPSDFMENLISSKEKISVNTSIAALTKNKKIEYVLYSKSKESIGWSLRADGADLVAFLLGSGMAFLSEDAPQSYQDLYMPYELDAKMQRRGLWAEDGAALLVDAKRENDRRMIEIAENGVLIAGLPPSGLVESGSTVSISTNVPAIVRLAFSGGVTRQFLSSHTGTLLALQEGHLRVDVSPIGVGGDILADTQTQLRQYVLRKQSYAHCIRIVEAYPSPLAGEHEWIELQNICNEQVDITGWKIDDAPQSGSNPFVLPFGSSVSNNGMLVLSGSLLPIALNNSGDAIVLYSPDGKIQDVLTYGSIARGTAIALLNDAYCFTSLSTPGIANICMQKPTTKKATSIKISDTSKRLLSKIFVPKFFDERMNMIKDIDQTFYFSEGVNVVSAIYDKRRNLPMYHSMSFIMYSIFLLCGFLLFVSYKLNE